MPSLELNKLQAVTGVRALSDTDRTAAQPGAGTRALQTGVANAKSAGVSLEIGASVNTSAPPVDTDRVDQIRTALREGRYPLVPAEISDAMIAAQLSHENDR